MTVKTKNHQHYILGIDLGATEGKTGVVGFYEDSNSITAEIIYYQSIPTKSGNTSPSSLMKRLEVASQIAIRKAELTLGHQIKIISGGMVIPGYIDKFGVIEKIPMIPGWKKVVLTDILRQTFPWICNFSVGNDATGAAFGEYLIGAGRDVNDDVRDVLIYITLSSGVGGRLVFDGKPFIGYRGKAGEIGHMTGIGLHRCGCGLFGCVEASGLTVNKKILAVIDAGAQDMKSYMRQHNLRRNQIRTQHIADAAREGVTSARSIIEESGRQIGQAIADIINLLNPGIIIIGGGFGKNCFDLLEKPILERVAERALPGPRKDATIVKAKLVQPGIIGAAALAHNEFMK